MAGQACHTMKHVSMHSGAAWYTAYLALGGISWRDRARVNLRETDISVSTYQKLAVVATRLKHGSCLETFPDQRFPGLKGVAMIMTRQPPMPSALGGRLCGRAGHTATVIASPGGSVRPRVSPNPIAQPDFDLMPADSVPRTPVLALNPSPNPMLPPEVILFGGASTNYKYRGDCDLLNITEAPRPTTAAVTQTLVVATVVNADPYIPAPPCTVTFTTHCALHRNLHYPLCLAP